MHGRRWWVSLWLLVACFIQLALISASWIPLGIPGEWTWSRVPAHALFWLDFLLPVLVLVGYFVFVQLGENSWQTPNRLAPLWLVGLIFSSTLVLWSLRGTAGEIYGHSGLTWVTYYPRMSGYFTEASQNTRSLTDFLSGYEDQVREGDYLHLGTHPPGLILYFRGLLAVCEQFPAVTKFLLIIEPDSVKMGTDILRDLNEGGSHPLTDPQRAVLWANQLLTFFLCAATVVPLFWLLRLFCPASLAWRLSSFWPLLPALAIFAPKSDLLLPVLACLMANCWVQAILKRQWIWALVAGFVTWLGLMISLALLVIPVILAAWTIFRTVKSQFLSPTVDLASAPVKTGFGLSLWKTFQALPWGFGVAYVAGILIPIMIIGVCCDLNLLTVWSINLSKHAEFYEHNTRTYFLWLLVNLVELALSLGAPLFVLLVIALKNMLKSRFATPGQLWSAAVVLVWGLLWVSGKNMGEAARLWIFLFPLLLTVIACGLKTTGMDFPEQPAMSEAAKLAKNDTSDSIPWTLCYLTQAVVALGTVSRIDGFDFSNLLP